MTSLVIIGFIIFIYFYLSKKNVSKVSKREEELSSFLSQINREDYLGHAATAKSKAKSAVKLGQYDEAWRQLHKQKQFYLKHASRCRFTTAQTLALEGSVHEDMADMLRLEGKHYQAFADIIFWIITSQKKLKRHNQKLTAYFNRCKFKHLDINDVKKFIKLNQSTPDYVVVRNQVHEWQKNN